MKYKIMPLVIIGLAGIGAQAFGDDTNSDRPVKSHRQLMHECVAKHKAADSSASQQDLKKACQEEIKSYNNHPSATSPSKTPGT